MPRLSREVILTEKLDGTNASVCIYDPCENTEAQEGFTSARDAYGKVWNILAGSRTRWITPQDDNHGFARWVWENAEDLVNLGPGHHFGEYWGSGINRGYGLKEKRFSLFNVQRWALHGTEPKQIPMADPRIVKMQDVLPACCGLVPLLYKGIFETSAVEACLKTLKEVGSAASPGYKFPEGIVLFHIAGNVGFKKTIEKDEEPKGKS
jgi:hypothetical protein